MLALVGGVAVYQLEESPTYAHHAAASGLALCLGSGYGCSR
ncbi:hypothetical protein N177_4049 [Lutibaculum baratangense AMV1]|uniref:Uncharacterized protein n=1 Tax=Lutibaculum baratangense AMV1 TaxID=631454 RepID=V4QT58_9HYPH|nr:hypothetical protein N177_4049 [Lutibaculum baratangense AMV1]